MQHNYIICKFFAYDFVKIPYIFNLFKNNAGI